MFTIIVIDSFLRFRSTHEFFADKTHFGYVTLSYDAYTKLPRDVAETLVQIPPEKVIAFGLGNA
jgi:hypothetical protein